MIKPFYNVKTEEGKEKIKKKGKNYDYATKLNYLFRDTRNLKHIFFNI